MGKIKYQTEEERKAAQRERSRRWREKHPEKAKESVKKWKEKNPEKVKEKKRRWYQRHKEEQAEYKKKHYQEHKEEYKEWGEKSRIKFRQTPNGRADILLQNYRRHDRKAGRGECTLTAQWIIDNIFTKPCAHCGKTGWEVIGCNRLDNSLPHTPDNVEPCCLHCNCKLSGKKSLS